MTAVILTFHVLIVLGLIVMVLLQRSEGGALGIGGGGGGGFMSGRGAANALTRTTSVLAAIFFSTSLGLAILAGTGENEDAVIEELTGERAPAPGERPGAPTTDDLLQSLGGEEETEGESTGEEAAPENAPDAGEAPSTSDLMDALGRESEGTEAPAEEGPEQPTDEGEDRPQDEAPPPDGQ